MKLRVGDFVATFLPVLLRGSSGIGSCYSLVLKGWGARRASWARPSLPVTSYPMPNVPVARLEHLSLEVRQMGLKKNMHPKALQRIYFQSC